MSTRHLLLNIALVLGLVMSLIPAQIAVADGPNPNGGITPQWTGDQCQVSGEVHMSRTKTVKILVHMNGQCTSDNVVNWTITSRVETRDGTVSLSSELEIRLMREVWDWLQENDKVTLSFTLDGVAQPSASATWRDIWPVWAWWEPMPDEQGRPCKYRWNGETDPRLVGTANGEYAWEEYHEETPWQTETYSFPDTETVSFGLTAYDNQGRIKGEFTHGPVPNPCYQPPTGSVSADKVDEQGNPWTGVTVELLQNGEVIRTGETPATFEDLELGDYVLRETVPAGSEPIGSTEVSFTLNEEHRSFSFTFRNRRPTQYNFSLKLEGGCGGGTAVGSSPKAVRLILKFLAFKA